jgi:hypothetical protein
MMESGCCSCREQAFAGYRSIATVSVDVRIAFSVVADSTVAIDR